MAYVMIVDDDEDYAAFVARVLSGDTHEVSIKLDTDSAMAAMKERRPDLVILDVVFPDDVSAGFELARAMRLFHQNLRNVPILMLTAVNARFPLGFSAKDIDKTWLPISDFLEKPADFHVLRNKVNMLLQQAASSAGDA